MHLLNYLCKVAKSYNTLKRYFSSDGFSSSCYNSVKYLRQISPFFHSTVVTNDLCTSGNISYHVFAILPSYLVQLSHI